LRTVEYFKRFDEANLARIEFTIERGRILRFVVQLECWYGDDWHPVLRYDTAHGFAHRDVLHPRQEASKEPLDLHDHNEALTFAMNDLSHNWLQYRRRYEEWLTQKP
jgi:hypothetical protein